jgi:thiazole biosynthesis enzyme
MREFNETQITKAIIDTYYKKLSSHIVNDVLIVGAGPAGMTAATHLARRGFKVTMIERHLAPGGGIWGGGMGMNDVIIQDEARSIIEDFDLRLQPLEDGLYAIDAVELSAGLCLRALHAGAAILNLVTLEDVSVHDDRVTGVVVNRTGISGRLHVDPLTFSAKAVLDATGHDAYVLNTIRRRGFFRDTPIEQALEGPMNAHEGEKFVVDKTGEVYPGLWVAGMSVCAAYGGPRMGPIFGGMLLSGKRVADLIADRLTGDK